MTTNGVLTTLASFYGTNGICPEAGLTLGNDGNFYGTTFFGGITNSQYLSGMGTVFKVTTNGVLAKLVSFANTNGVYPNGLTLGNDGNLYGTTFAGGDNNYGTVFKVTTNGALTTLDSFNGVNGVNPQCGLTLGNDGNFYGTTTDGGVSGVNGAGTIFCLSSPPPALGPPALCISTYGGQPAVFFPTATGTNFVLQMTTNLAAGNWVAVSNGIPISGIIITNPPGTAFFRLH
jgi:uncharacterized repeat protein (TIGR03803 family)